MSSLEEMSLSFLKCPSCRGQKGFRARGWIYGTTITFKPKENYVLVAPKLNKTDVFKRFCSEKSYAHKQGFQCVECWARLPNNLNETLWELAKQFYFMKTLGDNPFIKIGRDW